uniref:CCHC-type domain-containing protein n=1 Tax=Cannabis sativa TaxID=3483 RepID=A0A803P9C0_CANSA
MASNSKSYQEVEEQYANISLDGEDDGELSIDFLVLEDQVLNVELCIVGWFLTSRAIDFEAMRHVMASLWQPGKGVYAKEIDTNCYLFQFFHEIDLETVVEGTPWTFNRVQFVFHDLRRGDDPKRVLLNNLDIWVQIHGLQLRIKSGSVVERLGNFVGTYVKADPKNFQNEWRDYMRVRVTLDITVPLRRRRKLRRTAMEEGFWAEFKYEYLPTFCIICGIIGHSKKFCPKFFDTPAEMLVKLYGAWMRAQPRRRNNLLGSQWLRDGNETDEMFADRFNGGVATASVMLQQQPRREEVVGVFCGNSVLNKGGNYPQFNSSNSMENMGYHVGVGHSWNEIHANDTYIDDSNDDIMLLHSEKGAQGMECHRANVVWANMLLGRVRI